jgi:hypothetical protein
MLKCREVERIVGSDHLSDAGFMERLAINLHLMMCRHCRAYARQIHAIGKAARDVFMRSTVDTDTLKQLKSRIIDKRQ